MKKFYILLFALLSFNGSNGQRSIPASQLDASAHRKHPEFNLQHTKLNSLENVHGMVGNKEWETSGIFSDKNSQELINHRTSQQRSLIQLYDSIYYWNWDTLSFGWEIASKTSDMVYDGNNNLTSELEQTWNGSTWGNYRKTNYTYDDNNNQTSWLEQYWSSSAWRNSSLTTYTYDANNFITSQSSRRWNDNGTRISSGDSTHYYFHTVLGINDLIVPLKSFTVYPSPTSTTITIELSNTTTIKNTYLTIYNLNGQPLIEQQITEPTTLIDIGTLPSGIYVVRLIWENGIQVGKFVKK